MNNVVRMPIKAESNTRKRNIYAQSPSDVKRLINNTINELRSGDIDSKSANAIGYLANILLKVFETEDLLDKLREMEEKLIYLTKNNS